MTAYAVGVTLVTAGGVLAVVGLSFVAFGRSAKDALIRGGVVKDTTKDRLRRRHYSQMVK